MTRSAFPATVPAPRRPTVRRWLTACGLAAGVAASTAAAVDLSELSLEELLSTKVTLASRSEEDLFDAPAAIAVITAEDLRRSGVTSIPEALRLVPGLQVARIDASKWSVASRGTGFRFENELLVLVDGRSVYSPLSSGVYWEIQDLLLEDVEQIEVIRGPGGALWGANAFSGIVNIVTKDASRTPGGLVALGLGTVEKGFQAARYGGRWGQQGHYRIHARHFSRGASADEVGEPAHDPWNGERGGFRADWTPAARDHWTVAGEAYRVRLSNALQVFSLTPPFIAEPTDRAHLTGGYLRAQWERRFAPGSEAKLQVYFDRTRHREIYLTQRHHIYAVDFQHRFGWGSRHDLTYGADARAVDDRLNGSFMLSLTPSSRRVAHVSAFVQDDVSLLQDRVRLTLGSKVERDPRTGYQLQPNLRARWSPNPRQVLWAAVSRAVRTPSRSEVDGRLVLGAYADPGASPAEPPVYLVGQGAPGIVAEKQTAFEAGWRLHPVDPLLLDLAAYLHVRRDGLDATIGEATVAAAPAPSHLVVPVVLDNVLGGENWGAEALVRWEMRPRWNLQAGYTLLETRRSGSATAVALSDRSKHRFTGRLQGALPAGWTLDAALRCAGALEQQRVDGYVELDLRAGWQVRPGLEVSLVGQNLLAPEHPETVVKLINYQPTQVPRGAYARLQWLY